MLMPFAAAVLGIALFSAMDAVMKAATLAIGAYNAVLWRVLIGIPISGGLFFAGSAAWPSPEALRLHIVRSAVSAAMSVTFFYGLARMPIAEGIALSFVAPIIALYLASLLLGETISRHAVLASLLGFAGVLLIVLSRPAGGDRDFWGIAAILFAALLYAYNIVLMRQQALVAGPREVAFFQNILVAILLGAAAPFFAYFPPFGEVPGLALAALFASVSLLLLAWAYRRAEAQHLAPVEYSALIWAVLLGYLMFDEIVTDATLLGAGLIIGGCVLAARANRAPASPAEAAL